MSQDAKRQTEAVVIGRTGDKSIKASIGYTLSHPKYGKFLRRQTVLGVHDEANEAAVGDTISIAPSRPYSKTKKWRLVKVVKKSAQR